MTRSIPVVGWYGSRPGMEPRLRPPGVSFGKVGYRCFFGVHDLVSFDYLWNGAPISRRTYCGRCGYLEAIHLLSESSTS